MTGSPGTHQRILIVDDEPHVRESMCCLLEAHDFDTVGAAGGREALGMFEGGRFDLVITDIIMPEMDGLEVIRALRKMSSTVPIVAVSGGSRGSAADYLTMAGHLGARATLDKPFNEARLVATVERALAKSELEEIHLATAVPTPSRASQSKSES